MSPPADAVSSRFVVPRHGRALLVTLLLVVGLFTATCLNAAEFFSRVWTTEDGLPHNNATKLFQDTQGYVWIATTGGLARFDGRQFREYLAPDSVLPAGTSIRNVAEEKPGVIAVLAGGVIARLEGETWSRHPSLPVIGGPADIADFQPGVAGVLWILRGRSVVRWSEGQAVRTLDVGEALDAGLRRRTLTTDAAGNLWIGGGNLVMVRADGTGFEKWPDLGAALVGGRAGRVWVCTADRVISIENGERVTRSDRVPWTEEFVSIRCVYEDANGDVWMGSSRHGLYRMHNGIIDNVRTPFASAAHLAGDSERNLWVATLGDGIAQIRENPFRIYNAASGLGMDVVSAVETDADGGVWMANRSGGLALLTAAGELRARVVDVYANTVCAAADGSVLVGGGRDGVYRWLGAGDAAARMSYPESDPHVLFRASNGDVWFAASPGILGFYRGETPRVMGAAEGFTRHGVQAIAQDASGTIWAGTREGVLLEWDGKVFRRFEGMQRIGAAIHAIHADADGLLWIGTARGLVVKDGASVHQITEQQGLADNIILGIGEDHLGQLWLAARRGLFFTDRKELLEVARGQREKVTSHPFGRNYGLPGLNPTANYQPNVTRSPDGRLWFATAQGAIAVDPAKIPHDLPVPPVVIDQVLLDNRPIVAPGMRVRIPSGQHRVEFRIAALGFTAPENVLVRHRLDGVDTNWVDTGSDRVVSYSSLAPGEYLLRVTGRNSAGQWNTQGASLRLTVVPRWWETPWFRAGFVILLTAGSALVARTIAKRRLEMRLRRLEQAHALEKERARIARDLHDDLGASLTEVGLVADRLVASSPPDLATEVASLAWRTRRLSTDLSGIVWTMGATNTSLDRFAAFLVRYSERLFRSTGTRCLVRGADAIPAVNVPPGVQHQMIAIAREAINNVVKHAKATEAVLSLSCDDEVFELSICDNGAGFDVEAARLAAEGNGLRNIFARAREIGGSLDLTSTPGGGSRLVLRVPIPGKSGL